MKNALENWKNNLKVKDYINLFIFAVLVVGMVFSPFMMTVGLLLSSLVSIYELINWKEAKRKLSKGFVSLLCICSVFFLNIIGTLWSDDKIEALRVIEHTVPLFVFSLYFCLISPLKKELFDGFVLLYLLAMLVGTVMGITTYLINDYANVRELVLGARNIAFSIKIAFAIAILCLYAFRKKRFKTLSLCIALWFLIFLIITQMMTGLITVILLAFISVLVLLFRNKNTLSRSFAWVIVFVLLGCSVWVAKEYVNYFSPKRALSYSNNQRTKSGNLYLHDYDKFIENGYYVSQYICPEEVETEWQKRTGKTLDDSCKNAPYTYQEVIYRYLNSKGLKKDKEAIESLTEKDIENINQGYANIVYAKRFSLKPRLYQTFFEFERFIHTGKADNMSLIQRFVRVKNACIVIPSYFVFGTGTGDEQKVLIQQIEKDYPEMECKDADPHNQFIYVLVGFGVIGLALFVASLLYLPTKIKLWKNIYFDTFFIVSMCYMFSESALRMISGMLFFSIFFTLIVFNKDTIDANY